MKVLVTGSQGYIGAVLVPMLLERGHEAVGLDSNLYGRCTFTGDLTEVETMNLDIRDVQKDHLVGFGAMIHLAGLSNDPLGDYDPKITEEINAKASIRLANLAKGGRGRTLSVRFIMQQLRFCRVPLSYRRSGLQPRNTVRRVKSQGRDCIEKNRRQKIQPDIHSRLYRLRYVTQNPI